MESAWQKVDGRDINKVSKVFSKIGESARSIMNELYLVHDRDIDGCFAGYLFKLASHRIAEDNLGDKNWMCGKPNNTLLSVIHRQGGYSRQADINKQLERYIGKSNTDDFHHKNIVLLGISPSYEIAHKLLEYLRDNKGLSLLIIDKVEEQSTYNLLKDYWVALDTTKVTSVSYVLNYALMASNNLSSPYPEQIKVQNLLNMLYDVTHHTIVTSVDGYFKSIHEKEIFGALNLDINTLNCDKIRFISEKLRLVKKAIGVNAFIRQVFAFYICKDGLLLDVNHDIKGGIVDNNNLLSPRLKKQVDDIYSLNISMYYENTKRTGYRSGSVLYIVSSLPLNIDIADYILKTYKDIACVVVTNVGGNKIEYYSHLKGFIDKTFDFTGEVILMESPYMRQHSIDGCMVEYVYRTVTKKYINLK